jgi:DNA-binding CsgD family transcriptional regulator
MKPNPKFQLAGARCHLARRSSRRKEDHLNSSQVAGNLLSPTPPVQRGGTGNFDAVNSLPASFGKVRESKGMNDNTSSTVSRGFVPSASPHPRLTKRQHQIVTLAAQGLTMSQVARHLGLSQNTVKVHLRLVYRRLGVRSRLGCTLYGFTFGVVFTQPPTPTQIG